MPAIDCIADFNIKRPVKKIMPNGVALNIIDTGMEDVIRLDLVTSAEIAEKLDFYGAWLDLSSSVNSGFITLYSLGKFFEKTIGVLAQMVKEPVFPERELRIVTEANKQMYLVNAQRVEVMARKRLNRELFGPEHPLGRFAETEDYERLSAEMLKGFYRENYYSDNCTMFVAGRVTDIVLKCIEEHFGETPWGENRKKMNPLMPEPRGAVQKRVTVEKKDGMQSSVKIGCFLPDRMHEDLSGRTRVIPTA